MEDRGAFPGGGGPLEESGARILVVDDDRDARTLVAKRLRKAGYEVTEAPNGEEAFRIMEGFIPDLVLTDIRMPVMDGLELARRLKESFSLQHVPVIFLSAKNSDEDVIEALKLGGGYVTKPFSLEVLTAKVGAMLRLSLEQRRVLRQAEQFHEVYLHEQQLMMELEEANKQLERLNAAKEEFLGMAAHDLRNPLTGVLNYAEFLVDNPDLSEEQRKEFAGAIRQQAQQMILLINDILDISKIEAGKLDIKPAVQRMEGIVDACVPLQRSIAEKKSIRLLTDFASGLPEVQADANRVTQVLNNLLSNAVKFSRAGDAVTIRCVMRDGMVETQVVDTGQGIPEEDLPKLFGKFQQVSTQATAGEVGTGLGLAIVKKIVELHGGRVRVESRWGQGTTFAFTLPSAAGASARSSG
jgi:signal transduction histidine kinase